MAIGWIPTYTGRKVYPYILHNTDIDIRDIAHGLACACRYSGQCKRFYSVAEHSVYVASLVPAHLKLAALLHDASEAYLGDVSTRVKDQETNTAYRVAEGRAMVAVSVAFRLLPLRRTEQAVIHNADRAVAAWEIKHLGCYGPGWDECREICKGYDTAYLVAKLPCVGPLYLSPRLAEAWFLENFTSYSKILG